MEYRGFVIHDSQCPSINGKGYDYFIMLNGDIISAAQKADPMFIHICIEGSFSQPLSNPMPAALETQFFNLYKLIARLGKKHRLTADQVYMHHMHCPEEFFPWHKLVILPQDGYH